MNQKPKNETEKEEWLRRTKHITPRPEWHEPRPVPESLVPRLLKVVS